MKKLIVTILCALALSASFAKGGGSSGGRGGGFSGGGRSVSSAPASRPSAAPAPAAPRANVANAPTKTNTTTSTTTSTTQTSRVTSAPMAYGGMGMGYGYSNGLLTGLIIGNMMHPHNTVVYNGGGYSGNALLYPDGRVVNQQGVHVGNYSNNQFTAVNNGQVVAQAAPADAVAQPVIIQKTGPSTGEIILMIIGGILCVLLILMILA